jgi:hypothetical protein
MPQQQQNLYELDLQRFCLDHQRVCWKRNCFYIDKTLRLTVGPYLAYDLFGCWVAWTLLCSWVSRADTSLIIKILTRSRRLGLANLPVCPFCIWSGFRS